MALEGQRVVIVGGTSGIGLAAAQAFLDSAATVVIASRSGDKLAAAQKSLSRDVTALTMDFRSEESRARFFQRVGRFDHLVITAGDGIMGAFSELLLDDAKAAFESKFWGQYATARAALPYLDDHGSITLTSGVYAVRPPRGAAPLAAINSAVEGLTRALAVELAPIRVNAVSPGIVDTPLYHGMTADERRALFDGIARQLPVGHIATSGEIAKAYTYLAESEFSTGVVVLIDGGAHLV